MLKSRASKWLATATVLALAIPMSLGAASAHSYRAATTVTISRSETGFRGRVDSGRPGCISGRTVTVMKVVADAPDKAIGTDTTDGNGRYAVARNNPHGTFYAKVSGSSSRHYSGSHVCLRDRSTTVEVA